MNVALYATIWAALALFVAGEAGKRAAGLDARAVRAWRAWTLGAALCALHMALAFHVRHHWSLEAARVDIARKTEAVFGLAWDGGVYVNFVFLALWLAETAWWRADPRGYARRPRWIAWPLRGFALLMLASGAVVFASPLGRVAGVPLVLALLWAWRPAPGERATAGST